MAKPTDILVKTTNPDWLDQTIRQLPGPPALLVADSWDAQTEVCRIRVFGDPGFLVFAITQQGYGEVVGQEPVGSSDD